MIRSVARVPAGIVILALVMLGLAIAPAQAGQGPQETCSNKQWLAMGSGSDCPKPKVNGQNPDAAPKEKKQSKGSDRQAQKKSDAKSGPIPKDYKKAYSGDDPVDGPGQWAKANAEGAQGLAQDLAKRVDNGLSAKVELNSDFFKLYSIMFGLGWFIAVAATVLAMRQFADRKIDGRAVAQHAFTRLILFTPIAAMVPLLLTVVADITGVLSSGFLEMVKITIIESLMMIVALLGTLTAGAIFIPGGSAVAVAVCGFLATCLVGVIVELTIAKFLVYLLALLIPILFAASINPRWTGGIKKVCGGLLAAFLAAPSLFLVWAAVGSRLPSPRAHSSPVATGGLRPMRYEEVEQIASSAANHPSAMDAFSDLLTFIVALLVALAAPVAIGIILSYVVPAFAELVDVGGKSRAAVRAALNGTKGKKGGGHGGQSDPSQVSQRASRASRGEEIAKNSAGKAGGAKAGAGAGGAAAAGGVAGGVAGAAAAAGAKIAKKAYSGMRGSQSRVSTAAAEQSGQQGSGGESPRSQSGGGQQRPGAGGEPQRSGSTGSPRNGAGQSSNSMGRGQAAHSQQRGSWATSGRGSGTAGGRVPGAGSPAANGRGGQGHDPVPRGGGSGRPGGDGRSGPGGSGGNSIGKGGGRR